jgi:hypothetical protein
VAHRPLPSCQLLGHCYEATVFPSSGFSVCDGLDDDGHLILKPIIGFIPGGNDDRVTFVEPLLNETTPSHPGRLVVRPDGWYVTPHGGMHGGMVGDEAAALRHFQQPHRSSARRQRWSHTLFTAPLESDERILQNMEAAPWSFSGGRRNLPFAGAALRSTQPARSVGELLPRSSTELQPNLGWAANYVSA